MKLEIGGGGANKNVGGDDKNIPLYFPCYGNEALIQCNSIQFIMHNLHQLQDSQYYISA